MVRLEKVTLRYGQGPEVLRDLSFHLEPGSFHFLVGPSGAGKSSLLRILDGRSQLDDGEIRRVSGLRVATVEQEPELPEGLTVLEALCGDILDTEDWGRPARAGALIDSLGLNAEAPIAGLSGGTRKRVALARALALRPDVLLLDEPTSCLDAAAVAQAEGVFRTEAARGAALLIVTHDPDQAARLADRHLHIGGGRLREETA